MPSLPYHEPSITQLLTLSSFLLALNAADALLDRSLYCGLVGQVLVGVAWGAPGAAWLSPDLQVAAVQLGYLGLVLIVFEGGASTSVDAVRRYLPLSAAVALTGVAAPLALSFAGLRAMADASLVQCFAAGAALCSTSLGTTFAVLSASGLADTRLGCVLGTAAMMDDVLGLVMVQIVSSLGAAGSGGGGDGEVSVDVGNAVLRPVLVSLGFAAAVPLACRFMLRPLMPLLRRLGNGNGDEANGAWWWRLRKLLNSKQTGLVVQTMLVVALTAGASYAGASVLLAAYLAGIVVSWWADAWHGDGSDTRERSGNPQPASESPHEERNVSNRDESTTVNQIPGGGEGPATATAGDNSTISQTTTTPDSEQPQESRRAGTEIYEIYYSQAVTQILKPLFFASVGFSIPISDMFSGDVAWRGIIYSILMAVGKILCGLWLVRFPVSVSMSGLAAKLSSFVSSRYRVLFARFRWQKSSPSPPKSEAKAAGVSQPGPVATDAIELQENNMNREDQAVLGPSQGELQQPASPSNNHSRSPGTSTPAKPLSLYPAAIVASAMVARGEIGFLISAVAESNGVFRRPSDGDGDGASGLFLIVTWAIVLCTIVGPICVGVLVRRVKKLEGQAASVGDRGTRNVLGVWGVQ
ncbi:Sodium/hydrogen exchanger [Hypoxylon crocopeplum]|nr:Sodium/hydrogen exchanger [Hypoxylon crocopeplum]